MTGKVLFIGVFAIILCVFFAAGAFAEPSGKLVIYHAGSLSVPFAAMEKTLEEKYPNLEIERKSGGSTKMARLISDKGEAADIMASADYVVIDKNLIPNFATWNVRFASNQLVLTYTEKSKYADEINAKNWAEILQRKDVVWGHSDPNLDPCGYRSLMVLQLAEKFYDKPGLYDKLVANRPKENVLPKAVQLIKKLKSGEMDYAWEYLSVAVQHGLKYVTLDDHINLGNYKMTPFYKEAKVTVTGKKAGTTVDRVGKSITYGITMTNNAENKDAAEAFLKYLFDPDGGLAVLKSMGQPPFVPVRVPDEQVHKQLPPSLQPLVEVKK